MNIRSITEEEVRERWVQRLSDTPNRRGRFGTAGMTAAEMKAAYDALPLLIVGRFNALVDAILTGEIGRIIPATEDESLADLLAGIRSGRFAELLTVDGARTLTALAAALDTHTHGGVYAPLDADGRIPASLLPSGYDPKFEEAERERAEAEARREAVIRAVEETIAALEEREGDRDRRESDREARLAEVEERLGRAEATVKNDSLLVRSLSYTVKNQSAATEGMTHTFLEDRAAAYEKRPPADTLPMARILTLGGTEGESLSPLRAVTSHGQNLLPFPYPAVEANRLPSGLTVTVEPDGSLILDGTATSRYSYILYRETDGLALPEEPIYIDGIFEDGVSLYLRTGSSGTIYKTGEYTPSRSDEYFGHYYVYLYIAAGSHFEKKRIVPSITRGATPRRAVAYRPPTRFEIPDEVRALPGYGRVGNLLDLEAGCYRQRYDALGQPLDGERIYPLDESFTASAWLPAEEDGLIVFENDTRGAVASTLLFGVRLW